MVEKEELKAAPEKSWAFFFDSDGQLCNNLSSVLWAVFLWGNCCLFHLWGCNMKISAIISLFPTFEELQKAGGEVDSPTRPPATGLHLATMYDDGSLGMPQHMLAVVVGDEVPSKWHVTNRWSVRSPIGGREIITVEFESDAIPLYTGVDRERIDVAAQRAAGLPIYEVHSMYSPRCWCVHWVPEEGNRTTEHPC